MKRFLLAVIILSFACAGVISAQPVEERSHTTLLLDQCMDSIYSPDYLEIHNQLWKQVRPDEIPEAKVGFSRMLVLRYYLLGERDSLEKYTELTKIYSREIDDLYNFYSTWVYLLNYYAMAGMSEHAIRGAMKMQEEATTDNYVFGIASSTYILGDVYTYLELYDEAIKQYVISIDEFSKIEDADLYGEVCNACFSLSVANILAEKYEDVFPVCDTLESSVKRSEAFRHNPANVSYLLVSQCSRSIANSRLGRLDEAKACLDAANDLFAKRGMQQDYLLEAQGTYYEATGQYKAAVDTYLELIKFYDDLGMEKEKNRFVFDTGSLYEKMGDYKKACTAYSSYITKLKALNTTQTFRQVNEFSVINNLNSIELEKKNLQIQVERQSKWTTVIIALLLLGIVIIIAVVYLREHRINARLHKALQDAMRADKLKSAFLANMSHEIRTPLNAIVGFSDLLLSTEDEDEKKKYSEIINLNNDLLLQLINDVLDLSKIESGSIDFTPVEFDVVPFMQSLVNSLKTRVDESRVKLYVSSPYTEHTVVMDKFRITQIVTNFISNAIKFTTDGEIKLSFVFEDFWLKISVSDTGIGIPEADQEKIFDRFYKVDDFSQGTGLGMAICKAMVNSCGGRIGLTSKVGEGSTFWAWLPTENS